MGSAVVADFVVVLEHDVKRAAMNIIVNNL